VARNKLSGIEPMYFTILFGCVLAALTICSHQERRY